MVCAKNAHTTKHGAIKNKTQITDIQFYNLDVIISVGYRVKSKQGTRFRQWATQTLRDYLLRGYIINQHFAQIERKMVEHDQKLFEHDQRFDLLIKTALPPKGVAATIYTAKVSAQLQLDLEKHHQQYPVITVRIFSRSHDRFLFIDDTVYLIGASLKDLGRKLFAFSKTDMKHADILR